MTPDEQVAHIERLNKGRLLRDASSELLPLLNQMRETTISLLIFAQREGKFEKLPTYAAELSVIESLRTKITQNNKLTSHLEEKLND